MRDIEFAAVWRALAAADDLRRALDVAVALGLPGDWANLQTRGFVMAEDVRGLATPLLMKGEPGGGA